MGMFPFMDVSEPQISRLRSALVQHAHLGMGPLTVLLSVAAKPGISISEVADMNGLAQQTASRHVANLSGRYQYEDSDQPELVRQSLASDDPRKRALELTSEGEILVKALLQCVYE